MAIIAFILVVIFTVINLRIYHKIFHVVYFNMGQALFREIFWSFFIAMFEAGVIITCIEPILNGVLKLLGILGKILLIVLAVSIVTFVIWKIVLMIKGKTDTDAVSENGKDDTQTNQDIFEQNKSGTEAQYVGQQNPASTDNNDVKEEAGNRKAELETEGSKETLKLSHGTKETFNIQKEIHMAACKSCGKSIDMNAKFCKYCGAKKEVRNESDMKTDIFTCPNCGKTIARNANFCHYCGEKIMSEIH